MSVNANQSFYIEREREYIDALRVFLNNAYGFLIDTIELTKRGYMAETYIAITKENRFFVKIVSLASHKEVYRESFRVIDFLNQNNIDFISKNIKTKDGKLTCDFEGGVVGLFEYIDGEHSDDYPLESLFEKYSLIYKVNVDNLNIKREDFRASTVELFESNLAKMKEDNFRYEKIISFFESKKEAIEKYKNRVKSIGKNCEINKNDFHVTHGDGQGNVIICQDGIKIIDWDVPLYSPIERDAWVFLDNQKTLDRFNKIINKNDIHYTLKKERLYYYCFLFFFYYLAEEIEIVMNIEDEKKIEKVFGDMQDLFSNSNWLYMRMSIASNS